VPKISARTEAYAKKMEQMSTAAYVRWDLPEKAANVIITFREKVSKLR